MLSDDAEWNMQAVNVAPRAAVMSLHFDDADPVATCHVLIENRDFSKSSVEQVECKWHAHGDSLNDTVLAWTAHLASDHKEDWE